MYYRISGAQFTIKSAEEKKEFIDTINKDSNFSNHLVCRGINAEQFTGKVNGVVVCEKDNPNKVYIFNCEGNFPTLKLYQRTSSVVYIVEFPVSKKGQLVLDKPEEEKEPEPVVEEVKPEPVYVPEEVNIDDLVVEEELQVIDEPVQVEQPEVQEEETPVDEPETQEEPVQEEQPVRKKRGRRKKS